MSFKRFCYKNYYEIVSLILLIAFFVIRNKLGDYFSHIMIIFCLNAYLGHCWNIIGGYGGQFSFGHSLFFGVGAYVTVLLLVIEGLSPWLGMLIGGIVSMGLGSIIGILCFRYRIKGFYFALITLAFAEIFKLIAQNSSIMGDGFGLRVPLLNESSFFFFQFRGKGNYLMIVLFMLLCLICIMKKIERSKFIDYLNAIRLDEEAGEAVGVNTVRYKTTAMVISAFLTSLGGTFYVQYVLFIDPEMGFGFPRSLNILLGPVVGGAGTLLGPTLGQIVLVPINELLGYFLGNIMGIDLLIYGIILCVIVVAFPRGLVGLFRNAD